MSTRSVISEHIEVTPGVCGGKPRIAGTRIRVHDVVLLHYHSGLSPEEIVGELPTLSLSDVYAALAFYHDNVAEIRSIIDQEEAFSEKMKAESRSILDRKLKARNASDDSVSSG